MPAAQPRSSSPWKRTRYWTTLACVTAVVAGLLTLAAGHPLHGWLMILGGLMLVKDTVLGRRGKRHLHGHEAALPQAESRKWRKAA